MIKPYGALISAILLGACTYNANVGLQPSYDVYSSYEDKVPGKWAIFTEHRSVDHATADLDGHQCSFHTFTFSPGAPFADSAGKTFENLVENGEIVRAPIPANDLRKRGYDGLIIISAEQVRSNITFAPKFFGATAIAEVDLTASISVFSPAGRLLGTTASESGTGRSDAGSACAGGTNAIREAAEESFKRVLRRLGERFASSNRIRNAFGQGAPAQGWSGIGSSRGSSLIRWVGTGNRGSCGNPWQIELTRAAGKVSGRFVRGTIEYDVLGFLDASGNMKDVRAGKNKRSQNMVGPRLIHFDVQFGKNEAIGRHYFGNGECETPMRLVPIRQQTSWLPAIESSFTTARPAPATGSGAAGAW